MINFTTKLKNHQKLAFEKLCKIKIGAILMEMGCGKSRTALELINKRLIEGKVTHIVWLCPCSVKHDLYLEIKKHVGTINFPLTIAGIESLSSSIKLNSKLLKLAEKEKVYLIVDESTLVKNHYAKRTQNIQRIADLCQYKMILNGTLISKSEKDLYAQWHILDWRILGYKSFWSFAANHLEYSDKYPGKINRVLNVDYLARKIAPYSYQVKKSECLDLPEKTYTTKYFYMTKEQSMHYDDVKYEFLMQVDEFDSTTIYRLFTACQHVLAGNRVISTYNQPISTEPFFKDPMDNPRLIKLLDIIYNMPDNSKSIIWCKFTDEIKNIEKMLIDEYGQESTVTFYGELNKNKRNISIEKFRGNARFFIANKTCAGYGLNLQHCNYAIYYSNDFNWGTRAQSEDRIHRIGQHQNVHIIDLVCWGTLDERIIKSLNKKESISDDFKYWIDKMKDKKELIKWIDGKEIGN